MKTALVYGNFNVVHPGHLRLLRYAKEISEHLIVAIRSDRVAGNEVILNQHYRLDAIKSINFVDEAIILDGDIKTLIEEIRPAYVVKGSEFKEKENSEERLINALGGQLVFCSGDSTYSGVEILSQDIAKANERSKLVLPKEFLLRHYLDQNQLLALLQSFKKVRVAVIGDLIVDEYVTCKALGMSQEDPTIVVSPVEAVKFLGGAGIVAAHAVGLGAVTHFFSVIGNDAPGDYAKSILRDYGVNANLIVDEKRPTILKKRYRSMGKTLLRVNHLQQTSISNDIAEQLLSSIGKVLSSTDLLIFSDFNYGCLPQVLVEKIIDLAKLHNVIIVADSQSSSQIGDVGRYKNLTLLTPTEREARISTKNYADGLVELAKGLMLETDAQYIFLKMGSDGVLVTSKLNESTSEWHTDQIPALNHSPRDVSGAGDSMLTAAALALSVGADIWSAALMGSIAAGIQVGRVGNIPITINQMERELKV